MSFQIGDKVKCVNGGAHGAGWAEGEQFVINKITRDIIYWGASNQGGVYGDSLELVEKRSHINCPCGGQMIYNSRGYICKRCKEMARYK